MPLSSVAADAAHSRWISTLKFLSFLTIAEYMIATSFRKVQHGISPGLGKPRVLVPCSTPMMDTDDSALQPSWQLCMHKKDIERARFRQPSLPAAAYFKSSVASVRAYSWAAMLAYFCSRPHNGRQELEVCNERLCPAECSHSCSDGLQACLPVLGSQAGAGESVWAQEGEAMAC